MTDRMYLTCAIDYVNSRPHIGTAYEKIGADVLARLSRLCGVTTRLQLGNDEHSANVYKSATEKNLDPLAYCDQMEGQFRTTWDSLDIAYDDFIRTSQPRHHRAVGEFFRRLHANTAPDGSPNIYKGHYTGWYCQSCEAYYTEKDITEKICPLHNQPVTWVEEENYFFALSKYRDVLLAHLHAHPQSICPSIRRNEMLRLLEAGLQDISISRAGGQWGIPLPIDPSHTVYVWFDALINYLTAVGFGADDRQFEDWWNHARVVHIIGKDITRFHCVIWPAMLLGAGLRLPDTVFGHGFVYFRGERMSKTLGNIIDPLELAKQYGADPLRYFLLRENSFGADGNFTWEHFIGRYNSDLANGIGNLVSRTVGMVHRYCGGNVPLTPIGESTHEMFQRVSALATTVRQALDADGDDLNFHEALGGIWGAIGATDRYINEHAPWNAHKAGDSATVTRVLANVAASLRTIAILLSPFLPKTAEKIWTQIGCDTAFGKLSAQRIYDVDGLGKCFPLTKMITLQPLASLFPRIEENLMATETTASPAPIPTTPAVPVAAPTAAVTDNVITIDDFLKIDLRAATITQSEKVAGADRLLKLQLDVGELGTRQIVAGIALHYTPEELVGRQICMVANLKPTKLKGVESQGMLLAAGDGATVSVLTPLKPMPNGSRVK